MMSSAHLPFYLNQHQLLRWVNRAAISYCLQTWNCIALQFQTIEVAVSGEQNDELYIDSNPNDHLGTKKYFNDS